MVSGARQRQVGAFGFRIWPLVVLITLVLASPAVAAKLDDMSLDRWAKLREVERYQLQIAEKYYREKNWKVALAEYEKYLTLYERGEGGSYAQLKWSLCQVQLRKSNTAIKEGFQSVIDYWPNSPDAVAAAYYIGRTYKDMGQMSKAKKAYRDVLEKHAKHLVAIRAMTDLIAIAAVEKDRDSQIELWKKLAFDMPRTRESQYLCDEASRQLAAHYFSVVAFNDGVKALATTYADDTLSAEVAARVRGPLGKLAADVESQTKGEKLATQAVAYFRGKMPSNTSDPQKKALARQLWFHIAGVYAAARLDTKVTDTYTQIMRTFGTDDETLGRLAGWHKSGRRCEDARRIYRRFQDKVEGLNQVAISYCDELNHELAVATYRELVGRDSENKVRWTSQIAYTYNEAKKYKEAAETFQELITLDPENAESWRFRVANAYRDGRQFKDAIGWYRQCTNFPANYKEMAYCHGRLKQYREALMLYAQVASGDAGSAPWAMLQIALTQDEAGQKEQAIKAFQQVCKRFPKDPHASRAHAILQNKYNISITLGGAKDE